MFGIEDPGIYLAYLAGSLCVIFSVIFGVTRWNKEYDDPSKDIKS